MLLLHQYHCAARVSFLEQSNDNNYRPDYIVYGKKKKYKNGKFIEQNKMNAQKGQKYLNILFY